MSIIAGDAPSTGIHNPLIHGLSDLQIGALGYHNPFRSEAENAALILRAGQPGDAEMCCLRPLPTVRMGGHKPRVRMA
jgi:hypothetical protein